MKILYVCNTSDVDNRDETAIAHALARQGHEVESVHEIRRHRGGKDPVAMSAAFDAALFHKWATVSEIAGLKCPAIFWFFDLLSPLDNDPTLAARSAVRERWLADVLALPNVILGALTDGDAVARDRTGKLIWLMQGFDGRNAHLAAEAAPTTFGSEVLFAGMVNHGQRRAAHVAHLQRRFGKRFGVVGDSGARGRVHGKELADLFASAKVVIAPDGPQTSRYASNRSTLVLGLGGFLLHPYCDVVAKMYEPNRELAYYPSSDGAPLGSPACRERWERCDELIRHYLRHPEERDRLRKAGHEATLRKNLYEHRVAELIAEVKRRL
jgi:hypothetical protein